MSKALKGHIRLSKGVVRGRAGDRENLHIHASQNIEMQALYDPIPRGNYYTCVLFWASLHARTVDKNVLGVSKPYYYRSQNWEKPGPGTAGGRNSTNGRADDFYRQPSPSSINRFFLPRSPLPLAARPSSYSLGCRSVQYSHAKLLGRALVQT